ncbi:MAG TPA: T9SS type A sorting domain-containing protein [Bacteroidales bacterium]
MQNCFARPAMKLFAIGNNVVWSSPSSWSETLNGPSAMLTPQDNDSIIISSNIFLNLDFTLTESGYMVIYSNCNLISNYNKLTIATNSKVDCYGYLKISELEVKSLAHFEIGSKGKVKVLKNFLNNSNLIKVNGILEVDGALQNNLQQGVSAITGKGNITGGTFSGNGSILGIANPAIIPMHSNISESTWTGIHSDDWTDSLNWSYNRLPMPTQHISILASPTFLPSIQSAVSCTDLLVNSDAHLLITSEGTLTISGNLVVAEGGELRLQSGISSHGSLITLGNTSGNIVSECSIIKNTPVYLSPSVSDAQSSVFLNMYLRTYNEPGSAWGDYIVPTNTTMEVMKGNEVFSTYTDIREFTGQPNTGNQQIAISDAGNGWNLVGNPYPSALDWGSQLQPANGWSKQDIYGAIYYWDNSANGNKSNYAVYCPGANGININGGSRSIMPNQGFFVKAKKTGKLAVTNDARINPDSIIQNSSQNNEGIAALRIVVRGNAMWDETVLNFTDNASSGFDSDFDAFKLTGNIDAPVLFSKLDDGTQLAINTMPNSSLSGVIPVGFSATKEGSYTLEIHGMNSIEPGIPVYLEDTYNNTFLNLRNDSVYAFDHLSKNDPMRFLLNFSSPTGIVEAVRDKPIIYTSGGILNIELANQNANTSIAICDMLGRRAAGINEAKQGNNQISLKGDSGYYIIKITDTKTNYTSKLWINLTN